MEILAALAYVALAALAYVAFFGGFGIYVAVQKHRARAEGFTFGVALGPFGLIILACLPTLEAAPIPATTQPGRIPVGGMREPRLSDAEWARGLSSGGAKDDASGIVTMRSKSTTAPEVKGPPGAPVTRPCTDGEWEKMSAREEAPSEQPATRRRSDAEWAALEASRKRIGRPS